MQELKAKIRESLAAVLPVTAIVMLLCITITPMPTGTLMLFLMGAFLLIVGMGLFTLGADMAMMPIGEKVGIQLTKSKRMGIIALSCFIIGVISAMRIPFLPARVYAGRLSDSRCSPRNCRRSPRRRCFPGPPPGRTW